MLRTRESRREEPLGVRMPDPIISHEDGGDPEQEAFAGRLGRPGAAGGARHPDAGRAARLRAARHVRRAVPGDRPDDRAVPGRGQTAREPFFAAARDGNFEALVAVLDPEVVLRADGARRAPAGPS
jgi:hypothetical protein